MLSTRHGTLKKVIDCNAGKEKRLLVFVQNIAAIFATTNNGLYGL